MRVVAPGNGRFLNNRDFCLNAYFCEQLNTSNFINGCTPYLFGFPTHNEKVLGAGVFRVSIFSIR